MIKLSDYLNYLNNEVVQARKMADINAIRMAKEYSKDKYLKYFKTPRFSLPSVKLNIPIKINALDSTTTYNFDIDYDAFVFEVNDHIDTLNKSKNLTIRALSKTEIVQNKMIIAVFETLEREDYKKVSRLQDNMKKVNISQISKEVFSSIKFNTIDKKSLKENDLVELRSIIEKSLRSRYRPVRSDLRNIFIDPDTSSSEDKGKILLNLQVEMIDEGIQIREVTDKNGNVVEEIIID